MFRKGGIRKGIGEGGRIRVIGLIGRIGVNTQIEEP